MIEHSAQSLFNDAVRHLHGQGGRSVRKRGESAYHGLNGRRCIVGVHIPDHLYDPKMEGTGISHLEKHYPDLFVHSPVISRHADTFRILMGVHDASMVKNPEPIVNRLRSAAIKLDVDDSLVDEFDWPEFWE